MRTARRLSPGHPDRACDLIAETIVDEYLRRDPASRLRVRVSGGRGALFVTGVASSKADFDVGAIATRAAAALGARAELEPFVAIESISGAEFPSALRTTSPVMVTGYATTETPEGIPTPVAFANRLAKRLEELRVADPDWFWLEPGFEVAVAERSPGDMRVFLSCAHGNKPLTEVREAIQQALASFLEHAEIRVNPQGPLSNWSLDTDIGFSGTPDRPYGSALPSVTALAGLDPFHPEKSGAWAARAVARAALARSPGARAVFVQAVYHPGDAEPSDLQIRDERGRDVSEADDLARMSRATLSAWFRPGLNASATRWGFVGEAELPWEQS